MILGDDSQKKELFLFASLLTLELSLAVMAIGMYMKGARPFSVLLSSTPGKAFLLAMLACVLSGAVIIHQYMVGRSAPSRNFRMVLTMNLITVMLVLFIGEIAVRVGSHMSSEGEEFGSVLLKPKHWDKVTDEYRTILDQASGDVSYMMYDNLMGWTVGPNKRSTNGPYYSSVDGIRASHEGALIAEAPEKTRIALVGDSFVFGDEVSYEDTWGYHLEKALGPEFQVLNFGVGGYSLSQAYLRYEKDVRKWNPKVVIFGFITHDIGRTMWVYPFLSMPDWKMPFSKPRPILREGTLVNINVPPLPPETIFNRGSIVELPFLRYDRGYKVSDWQERFFHHSYLARLFVSKFPRWTADQPDTMEEESISVNAEVLKTFVRSAIQAGSIPLIVYFPTRADLASRNSTDRLGKRVLQKADLTYTDPTPCLLEVPSSARFATGPHYSPQGNVAVTKCLEDVVREALDHISGGAEEFETVDGLAPDQAYVEEWS